MLLSFQPQNTAISKLWPTLSGMVRTYMEYSHHPVSRPFCAPPTSYADEFLSFPPCSFNGWAVFLPGKWHWGTFVSSYIGIPFFFIALGVGRYLSGQGMVHCCVMDFKSGLSLLAEQECEWNLSLQGVTWSPLF
jgi:hypothetical protein